MKKYTVHFIAVTIFVVLPLIYFAPMIEGKRLQQSDVTHFEGMAKEIKDFREKTGEEALWTNSMFSGMPAYLISMKQPNNILRYVHLFLNSTSTRPACHVFLYMLGFYILLILFGVNPWLGITGAIAYGFSSYLFIILAPGHLTKAMALGYMPMIIGSVYYTFRKNPYLGGALTSFFLGLQLVTNHLQITYYTFLILLVFGIFEFIRVLKEKKFRAFLRSIGLLIVAGVLAVSVNIVNIWAVYEYSPFSLRGPSELSEDEQDKTSGLDKSYATAWSYGVDETLNLLIPDFKGGASDRLIADRNSETYKFLSRTQGAQNAGNIINQNSYFFTQYWGTQPGTSGPVYIGAVLIFLFVLGMFFLEGRIKWWLFTVVIVSVTLSWGKNFMPLTDIFLDYFPGYNKFRTVSMILVIAELAIPLLAILTLNKLFFEEYDKKRLIKSLKYSLFIVGGLTLLFSLFPGISNLSSPKDKLLIDQGAGDLVSAIIKDREQVLRSDAFRSLAFVLLTAGFVYLSHLKKAMISLLLIGISILILVDLWPVNKRYLNDNNFVPKRQLTNAFLPYKADLEILKDKDLSYRVLDLSPGDPFGSSRAAYFHKSIGGYHGAKMRRYQDLYDRHIKNGNADVLDMLNTKYILKNNKDNSVVAERRTSNLGNAWFVNKYVSAENADEEIALLSDFDAKSEFIVQKSYLEKLQGANLMPDSLSSISLVSYSPNRLVYNFNSSTDQVGVFSEIYYPLGWKAYINGEEAEIFRVNYVLRALLISKGSGEIIFEFHPASYFIGNIIAAIASLLILTFIFIGVYINVRINKRVNN